MRYVYRPSHPKASPRGFVSAVDLGEYDAPQAVNAPVLSGRFYENACTVEGIDIGSRRKFNEHLRRTGLAHASDFTNTIKKKQEERAAHFQTGGDHKQRREAVARAFYEVNNGRRKR
jgi:hypothetical protein